MTEEPVGRWADLDNIMIVAGAFPPAKIEIGSIVRDWITRREGVIIARAEWINGNRTYAIQQRGGSGRIEDILWLDEVRLHIIKAAKKNDR